MTHNAGKFRAVHRATLTAF